MKLEEFKVHWQKQQKVSYSEREIKSIFQIRQNRTLSSVTKGFSWDLAIALIIALAFIALIQWFDLQTSNFWSVCLAIMAVQHIVFYLIQVSLINKYSHYDQDVVHSLNDAIGRLKMLLWLYRIWPASLTGILFTVYVLRFDPQMAGWQLFSIGLSLSLAIAWLSNAISAIMVRKHYYRLIRLKDDLTEALIS